MFYVKFPPRNDCRYTYGPYETCEEAYKAGVEYSDEEKYFPVKGKFKISYTPEWFKFSVGQNVCVVFYNLNCDRGKIVERCNTMIGNFYRVKSKEKRPNYVWFSESEITLA
jgi:hypothetical protein